MRALLTLLCWLMCGCCHAQSGALGACLDRLPADPAFAPLAGKLALGAAADGPPAMFADIALPDDRQRRIISAWAAARAECIRADGRYGNALYRPPLQAHGIDAENRVMAAAAALYDREISFGEFNRRRQRIAEELRGQAAALSRQIQSQQAALEQADRQAREREQLQGEIDDAELQASRAQQEAEAAKAPASRYAGAGRREGYRRYRPSLDAAHGNCFRFGSRLTCTGR
jgi:hypothetical protein